MRGAGEEGGGVGTVYIRSRRAEAEGGGGGTVGIRSRRGMGRGRRRDSIYIRSRRGRGRERRRRVKGTLGVGVAGAKGGGGGRYIGGIGTREGGGPV